MSVASKSITYATAPALPRGEAGAADRVGMVESSCRTLVGERLKCAGMRRSKAGANDVLALRSCVRSELYNDFWRHRHKPPPIAASPPAH